MKIGVVVHGPNIIDSGYALKIINILRDFGEVYCRLGGTMGRTAVIDASLESLIDISEKKLPSESVELFLKEDVDVILLLNYGKSDVTGHIFGFKVFKNSFFNNSFNKKFFDFIQVERPGESDGNIIHWTGEKHDFVFKLAKLLNLNILNPEKILKKYFKGDLKIFKEICFDKSSNIFNTNYSMSWDKREVADRNIEKVRNICGVSPDENIFVDGVIIGKSNSEALSLVSKNCCIVDIIGGDLNHCGVEKLGSVDIEKAIVKTGLLRIADPKPRIISNLNKDDNCNFNIAFIDYSVEDIYNFKSVDLAVTVGDEVTLLASDILYRFNIPVIGITNGSLDKVVEKGYITDESIIIELKSDFDDIVGRLIFKNLFKSKYYLKLPITVNISEDIKSRIFEGFKKEVLKIVNHITAEYLIKYYLIF